MGVGSNWAVEMAELNPKWETRTCVCCGEKFKVNAALFSHEDMCNHCREKMNKPDKIDEKDESDES